MKGATDAFLKTIATSHAANAMEAERWEVTVNPSKVSLTGPILISNLKLARYTARVVDDDRTTGFVYRWSTTGRVGRLHTADGRQSAPFVTPDPFVTYEPDASVEGTDDIIVEAILGGNVIGTETIEVTTYRGQIWLLPENISLSAGESAGFEVRVEDDVKDGGDLSYHWSTTGEFGTLRGGLNGFETPDPTNRYTARSEAEGSDAVTVEVFSTLAGEKRSLGTAKATVHVEKQKRIFEGRWGGRDPVVRFGQRGRIAGLVRSRRSGQAHLRGPGRIVGDVRDPRAG